MLPTTPLVSIIVCLLTLLTFSVGIVVQNAGTNVLTTTRASIIKTWVQGHIWNGNNNQLTTMDISAQTPARPSVLVAQNNSYFEMTRPLFLNYTQVDVTTIGLIGDGNTDNSKALQTALNNYANKAVLFFPYGLYVIENTVVIPPGTRMVGQVCAHVSRFTFAHVVDRYGLN